jgi:hypothetical protein
MATKPADVQAARASSTRAERGRCSSVKCALPRRNAPSRVANGPRRGAQICPCVRRARLSHCRRNERLARRPLAHSDRLPRLPVARDDIAVMRSHRGRGSPAMHNAGGQSACAPAPVAHALIEVRCAFSGVGGEHWMRRTRLRPTVEETARIERDRRRHTTTAQRANAPGRVLLASRRSRSASAPVYAR